MGTTKNVKPFQLPLVREQFQAALRKGHGRAPMHVTRFGADGLEDLICDACTTALAYDAQCEDSRVPWLIKMIDSAGIGEAVVPRIIQAMHQEFDEKGFWDKKQLCELAFQFAVRGRGDVRKALYASLSRNDHSADVLAADEIIQLDGSDGLLFVAERVGRWLMDDPESSSDTFIEQFFDETHGAGSAERILRSAAEHNEHIACFLRHLHREEDDTSDHRTRGTIIPDNLTRFGSLRPDRFEFMRHWMAEDLIRDIQNTIPSENRYRFLYRRWGSKADDEELRKIFEATCAEGHNARQRLYLHVFQWRGFPELSSRSFHFAESDDSEIRWIAYQIFAKHKHPRVRSLALDRIKDGKIREGELGLFIKNYDVGDWQLIQGALELSGDSGETHAILQDLLDVYEENTGPEAISPMTLVYEHSPCSNCRHRAAKVLKSIGALPGWIREECQHDADEAIRKIVAS